MVEFMEQLIEQAADLVSTSERIIVFTGAGVSTESGIPDFQPRLESFTRGILRRYGQYQQQQTTYR